MPIVIAIVAIIAIAVGGFVFLTKDPTTPLVETPPISTSTQDANTSVNNVVTPDTSVTADVPAATSNSKNFSSKVDYDTPAQIQESVAVTMTVENGVVTKVSNVYNGGSNENPYQQRFDTMYQSQVIGKKLKDISLSRVGGASLTSQAFNKAVQQFIAQS